MKTVNPLTVAIEAERMHSQTQRQRMAGFRGVTTLHEAAHAAMGYSYVPWGRIEIPFGAPMRGHARNSALLPEQEAKSYFAGCAMDRIIFGHGLFALHDFAAGMEALVRAYGHDIATTIAARLMDQAMLHLLDNLASIQALATAAMPKAVLAFNDFTRAAKKAGLERRGVGPKRQADVEAYLKQFAQTPEQLRADLGRETITRAHAALREDWIRRNLGSSFPCQCGCGGTLFNMDTSRGLVMASCGNSIDIYARVLRHRFGATAPPLAGRSVAGT